MEIWGCEFHSMLERNVDGLADFVAALDIQERLNPRQAMYGGRCNGTRLHVRAEDGEKIHYVDFTSLYPSVLRDERYPVDHPEIITGDFKPLDQYFGLAYVKILPPARLYHPVLPFRVNNKLYFPLCRTCATSNSGPGCECSDDDRALIGMWCTPELLKAVEMGYRIMKMYEVYHFPETTKYDPRTGTGGLFGSYINKFLKVKQEASGYPSDCVTPEDRSEYIRKYHETEGIVLDQNQIPDRGTNPGMRSVAKLLLNSLW